MLKWLRAITRFFQKTVGWNRVGVVLSLTIITIAVVVLVHMLRDIDGDEVITALKATETRLKGTGRVLLRASGTEPVIRVMIEGEGRKDIAQLADALAETIRAQAHVRA